MAATTTTDYSVQVNKYKPGADAAAIAGIVKHCGIALRNRDSALVSGGDKEEVARVVNGFLKKKLARTESDADLAKAVESVLASMKGERAKSRVTVYYLLADHFGQLDLFRPKAA